MISKLDSNGDGKVDRAEYLIGMLTALELVTEEK
jgi:hypothetical protein